MALTTSQPGVRTSWWTLNSYLLSPPLRIDVLFCCGGPRDAERGSGGVCIAGEVNVHESVKGNVRGKRIEIKREGSVNGDLTTAHIIIEDGAYFKGSIEIEKSAEAEKEGDNNVFSPRPAAARSQGVSNHEGMFKILCSG